MAEKESKKRPKTSERKKSSSLKGCLDRLDETVACLSSWLFGMSKGTARNIRRPSLWSRLLWGAGTRYKKKYTRKGRGQLRTTLDRADEILFRSLDRLDSNLLYAGRMYISKLGRVRSRGEVKIANTLFDLIGVDAVYEEPLELKDSMGNLVKLHPDFHITCDRKEAWIEYWGTASFSNAYDSYMARKRQMYKANDIPLINLFTKHVRLTQDDLGKLIMREFDEVATRI